MADDPYSVLGLSRDADAGAIRSAYRRLAKQNHPDLHPGDVAAEERFKRIGTAHALLSDPEKKARYDRGEIDNDGQERAPPGYGGGGWGGDPGDIFADMFRQGGFAQGGGRRGPRRGADRSYVLTVSFVEAVTGTISRVTLPGGAVLDVKVPAGIEDGQTLRLRGKGDAGHEQAPAGDALIRIKVAADARFVRDGRDLRTELAIDLKRAVLGGAVEVPTPTGAVSLTVPPDSDTGQVLRLRGRGLAAQAGHPAGNLYVTLRVVLGRTDESLKAFLRDWSPSPAV